MMPSVEEKEQLFVAEYLKDFNACQAAIRAGYSEKRGRQTGHDLLQKPHIRAAIEKDLETRTSRIKASVDRVLEELERLALYDPAGYVGIQSPEDIPRLPENMRRAITGWKWDKNGNFVLEFAKVHTLEMLGRHLKMFTDKFELSGDVGLAERLKEARERIK